MGKHSAKRERERDGQIGQGIRLRFDYATICSHVNNLITIVDAEDIKDRALIEPTNTAAKKALEDSVALSISSEFLDKYANSSNTPTTQVKMYAGLVDKVCSELASIIVNVCKEDPLEVHRTEQEWTQMHKDFYRGLFAEAAMLPISKVDDYAPSLLLAYLRQKTRNRFLTAERETLLQHGERFLDEFGARNSVTVWQSMEKIVDELFLIRHPHFLDESITSDAITLLKNAAESLRRYGGEWNNLANELDPGEEKKPGELTRRYFEVQRRSDRGVPSIRYFTDETTARFFYGRELPGLKGVHTAILSEVNQDGYKARHNELARRKIKFWAIDRDGQGRPTMQDWMGNPCLVSVGVYRLTKDQGALMSHGYHKGALVRLVGMPDGSRPGCHDCEGYVTTTPAYAVNVSHFGVPKADIEKVKE